MGHNLIQLGWMVLFLGIGWSLGAVVVWVKMNELLARARLDLAKCREEKQRLLSKCQDENQRLLTNVSALDDELDSLEAENGDLRELRIVCDTCMHEIPRWMNVQTVFSGKGPAMYKCEGCGCREDMESLRLDFPVMEEVN